MVNSVETGSNVQQATALFQQATQSSGAALEVNPVQNKTVEQPVKTESIQHNTGLKGEKPAETDTAPGAYLDITA